MSDVSIAIEQHFRPDEADFIQQAGDWIRQSQDEYRFILTYFLNPREQYILKTLVNRVNDLKVVFNGGIDGAESQRAIISPNFYSPELDDFELAVFEIKYPKKFTTLHHSTILGTLMHSGIKRAIIGDILNDAQQWQIIVDKKMLAYIQQTVLTVGRTKVSLVETTLNHAIQPKDDWEETFVLLASLRIDTVIATVFDLPRSVTKSLVEQQQVRLNWHTVIKPDTTVTVGDVISVRGYGRIQPKMLDGLSKKDKIKTVVNVIRR